MPQGQVARALVVQEYDEQVASQAEELAKQHALDFGAIMTAVLRYGPGIYNMVNKYGPSIIADINALFGRP